VAAPSATFVASALTSHAVVSSAFGNDLVFGAAGESSEDTGPAGMTQETTNSVSWVFDGNDLEGPLLLGFTGTESSGSGFVSIDIVASVNGTQELSQSFTSLSAAQAYFGDNTADLGGVPAGGSDTLSVVLDLATDAQYTQFGVQFLVAAAASVPVLSVPAAQAVHTGQGSAIGGISITDSAATVTVTLTDGSGTLSATGAGVSGTAHDLVISGSAAQVNADLATLSFLGAAPGADTIGVSASDSSAQVAVPQSVAVAVSCFATGTGIATTRGMVAVESLREGDVVQTLSGRLAPVRWLGYRRTDLRRHASPHDVMPVRVMAGAFGDSLPSRDLMLSPDHAVFLDGVLVPIRHLINGVSIVQEARDWVTYWHVELDRHDVVLAEGLACESYLDTGNRGAFANADCAVDLHPDFARAVWAAEGCAPILTDPRDPRLRALHTALLARASSRRAAAQAG
jgi:hypothetical protein